MILGEWSEAEDWYCRAARTAGKRFGDLCSTRRNVRLLLTHLDGDREPIEHCFIIPAVVAFVGHMVDQPGRENPRFPAQLEAGVREALRQHLVEMKAGFGYVSVACGSDILFAEGMLDLGAEVQVVLPYEKARFIRDSVDIIPGSKWAERCEAVINWAAGVTIASDHVLTPGGVQYEYSNLLLHGVALARARQLGTPMLGLAVWDGQPGDGRGGTASSVKRWRESGVPVEVVRIDEMLRSSYGLDVKTRAAEELSAKPQADNAEICSVLFADAVGFSKLSEEEVPLFVTHFLGLVGELADRSPHPPLVRNTWGDGLYFVFGYARDAGRFALELCERVAAMNWKEKGLRDLNLRVGLHVGPVYECIDPVTKSRNYIGTHVSRAARIEPITPPGSVYASQAFAAVAAVEQVKEFTCDYVGRIGMAKNYGAFPTYVVRRQTASDPSKT